MPWAWVHVANRINYIGTVELFRWHHGIVSKSVEVKCGHTYLKNMDTYTYSLFPLLNRRSKTPEEAFPYSAGKAPDIKSELAKLVELIIDMIPLVDPCPSPKWFGLGISIPSILHNNPLGEFPRMIISLFWSDPAFVTPAKFKAMRAGSWNPPAYRFASVTENWRVRRVHSLHESASES